MKDYLITNAGEIWMVTGKQQSRMAGNEMREIPKLKNGWIHISGGRIREVGSMEHLPGWSLPVLNARGGFVLPAFCDAHTHLVYPGSREGEFRDRILGLTYEEIARRGGGILNSAKILDKTPEEQLYEESIPRVEEIMRQGTGAVEIKSGYGLTLEGELKMLRVIRRIRESYPLEVKATFLGAHAIPVEYKTNPDTYVDLVINEMIPEVAAQKLADFIDVFCDRGFFTPEQTSRMLEAGWKHGLKPKIHANELDFSGGIQVGVRHQAVSVDHLEYVGDEELDLLLQSKTIPTVLPGASFFLGLPYAPARRMIDAGLPLALASDDNPGSSPSGNMKLMMSLACIQMKLLPEEALAAATLNGAAAMELAEACGSITTGKLANIIITRPIPSLAYLPYAYGSGLIDRVLIRGEEV